MVKANCYSKYRFNSLTEFEAKSGRTKSLPTSSPFKGYREKSRVKGTRSHVLERLNLLAIQKEELALR